MTEKLSLRDRLHEIHYWQIKRRTQKIIPWVARKLPRSLKYWVVIHGMCTIEPEGSPVDVTGMQLLDLWSPDD